MPRVNLQVWLPEHLWIQQLTTACPDTVFTVLSAMSTNPGGLGLVELAGPNCPDVVARMDDHEGVEAVEILEVGPDRVVVQFETTQSFLIDRLQHSGVSVLFPVTIEDGVATVEMRAPRTNLSRLREHFEELGVRFEVGYVYEVSEPDQLLSPRQREFVEAAVERGYYEQPRGASLSELAEGFGVAKSSASETLRRAEAKIVSAFLAGPR